jgi:predicted nucleic acid-binding protein
MIVAGGRPSQILHPAAEGTGFGSDDGAELDRLVGRTRKRSGEIGNMRIYLDTCSLQRPLDSKTQTRIILEADAVLGILTLVEAGTVELISSDALLIETSRTPNVTRQEYAYETLLRAARFVELDEQVEQRARELNAVSIEPLDALHLASAEAAHADLFCTCDDRLLKEARSIPELQTRVVSPLEAIEEIEQ